MYGILNRYNNSVDHEWRDILPHVNKVIKSVNSEGEQSCVDIFSRPDGTFGFEEYRRDIEDCRGWYPIGFYSNRIFTSVDDALSDAQENVVWLEGALENI